MISANYRYLPLFSSVVLFSVECGRFQHSSTTNLAKLRCLLTNLCLFLPIIDQIVDLFQRKYPHPLCIISPLYIFDSPLQSLPNPNSPEHEFHVTTLGYFLPVKAYLLREQSLHGVPRTIYLLECSAFSRRSSKDMYR